MIGENSLAVCDKAALNSIIINVQIVVKSCNSFSAAQELSRGCAVDMPFEMAAIKLASDVLNRTCILLDDAKTSIASSTEQSGMDFETKFMSITNRIWLSSPTYCGEKGNLIE